MIHWLHDLVWGPALLALLLGTGGYFTWKSGFFQVRGLPVWWKATAGSLLRRKSGEKERTGSREPAPGIGRLQAACTALAATIGTGNIVGVATALTAGGPGAIFWMWVSALLGMATAYAETFLGIRYRERQPDGEWFAGPCAYLRRGLGRPGPALLYGLLCLCASLGMGSMAQSNSISQTLNYSLRVPPLACGLLITALVLAVILGGAERITRVTGRMIPVAAAVYTVFSAAVLWSCRERIPEVFAEILRCALLPQAVLGGAGGYGIGRAFRYGIARGVFSNEAGLGTLAGLHGSTRDTTPREQGMWAMFEVFFDTIFICTLTALVILCASGAAPGIRKEGYDGAALTGWCFSQVLGPAGEYLVAASMILFAFSTMIAWYFLGCQTLRAVWGLLVRKWPLLQGGGETVKKLYLVLYAYAVFLGGVSSLTAVWELSDVLNGLMAFPNLLALFLLRREIVWENHKEFRFRNSLSRDKREES